MNITPKVKRRLVEIELSLIDMNPDQPREDFNEESIINLAVSIQEHTLLQVPIVEAHPTVPGRFRIVAGERRFRALNLVGVEKDIFILIEGELDKRYILSVIENCHRVDLNAIEGARAFRRLHDEEGLTWEQIETLTGQSISTILNKVKLLDLPEEIQQMVRTGTLPQVTALNLTTFRGERGSLMRMAHDLIAGRDPMALHEKHETEHSERMVQARLPTTAEDFMKRILKLTGRVYSMPAVLEAFLKLSKEKRLEAWALVNPTTRGKFRLKIAALIRALQAFCEMMELPVPLPVSPQSELEARAAVQKPLSPKPAMKPLTVPPRSTLPAKAASVVSPKTARNRPLTRTDTLELREWDKGKNSSSPSPEPSSRIPANDQSLEISQRALKAMFVDPRGKFMINISRSMLQRAFKEHGLNGSLEVIATNAFRHLRDNWKTPLPKKDSMEKEFILFIAWLRSSLGSPTFSEFLKIVERDDGSTDPIDLSAV